MLIESIIRRKGGSRITIGKTEYHFKPGPEDARHLCEVADEDHVQTFIAIKEGYRFPRKGPAAKADIEEAARIAAEQKAKDEEAAKAAAKAAGKGNKAKDAGDGTE